MADISISHLVKTYPGGTDRATDDVSLEIRDGDFTVLLGPSGCGKTTLLRMLAGLEFPDSGSVSVGGRDVTYLPPNKRNMSMVFQSYAVFPHRKVRYNIGFGLLMAKVDPKEIERKVQWAADLLQLTPYLDRLPAQLSGGQRQRVAVARAIVMDAEVLLMDEPLSNLDALLRLTFRSELKKIVKDLGTTTVYVTHDQSEALSLGDQVAVMRKGSIAQLGDPLDVYDAPADKFVGGFIGSPPMNFITAAVSGGGDALRVGEQNLLAPSMLRSFANEDIVLGVRAENIGVAADRSSGDVPATVLIVEPMGSSVLLTVDVDGQNIKVQAPPTFRTAPHDRIWLTFSPNTMRFYDGATSMALEAK